jgi:hypothetical protein
MNDWTNISTKQAIGLVKEGNRLRAALAAIAAKTKSKEIRKIANDALAGKEVK